MGKANITHEEQEYIKDFSGKAKRKRAAKKT
jgi:hypothetical protein